MSFLHKPELLPFFGPFNLLCPLISIFVAFLPLVWISFQKQCYKVSYSLMAWYAIFFYLAQFPVFTAPDRFDDETFSYDLLGFFLLGTIPVLAIGLFYGVLYRTDPKVQKFLHEDLSPSWVCAHQLYRMGGGAFLYLYFQVEGMETYFNLQTGFLDVFMGLTALPMAAYLIKSSYKTITPRQRFILKAWHAIGLYDLAFAFTASSADFFGLYTFQHRIGYCGYLRVTLIWYFQVPWALGMHIFYLVSWGTGIDTTKKES